MSLSSFLRCPDVAAAFERQFPVEEFDLEGELLARPRGDNPQRIGTAFDYLLRFFLQKENPGVQARGWVAENVPALLSGEEARRATRWCHTARQRWNNFLGGDEVGDDLLASALELARLDEIFRGRGRTEENQIVWDEEPDPRQLADLRALCEVWQEIGRGEVERIAGASPLILNPTFGAGSILVGGADADFLRGPTLWELKTTRRALVRADYVHQLLGYTLLNRFSHPLFDDENSSYAIDRIAIYFSRFGSVWHAPLEEWTARRGFEEFFEWFVQSAQGTFWGSRSPF